MAAFAVGRTAVAKLPSGEMGSTSVSPTYHVYVSDRGNIFMTEIAALLASALSDLGYTTVFPAPGLPEKRRDRINLVVAPHEFYPLQRHVPEAELLRSAEHAVTVGVEQPGTSWFDLGAQYSSVALAVLDISRVATAELQRRSIPARHLQLGYHPSWDAWGGDPSRRRKTDVLFLGSLTTRRDTILAGTAPYLWDCNTDIRLFEFPRPMSQPRGHFVAAEDKWRLLADSRVLLNIHRNEVPYFEWVRTLEAVINGCLVVTEPSDEYGPLTVGEHLVSTPADYLGAYAASLLVDEDLRSELTVSAYDLVRSKLEMSAILQPVCTDLEALTRSPSHRGPLQPCAPAVEPAPPHNPLVQDVLVSEARVRARIKELIDSETALIRKVEALQAHLVHADADHVAITETPAWDTFVPDVSVLITTYNSENFVADAMTSVFDSTGTAVELIVVDDHSEDRSTEITREIMMASGAFPTLLLARSANGGVSVARNAGLQRARGKYVFILDSDNRIYPNALSKLSLALDRSPDAALAYGIIAKSGEPGLLSYLPWDVERLCHTNYIDAMSMIRRSVFSDLGGYDAYFGLRGWEDYELWLRIAAAGLRGEFVPSFIGTYSVRPGSRQETVNLDSPALMVDLRKRFAFLPWS